jgi:LytR cell envelope-related transcriptional attenuator
MAELEQRLMAQLSRRTAPAPAEQAARPAPTGPHPVTPAGARLAPAPFAPPGVAAPALASATRFPGLVPAAAPAPAPVAAPAPVPAVAASAEPDDAAAARSGEPGRRAGGIAAGGTTTVAPPVPAATNGRSEGPTEITPPPPPPPRRSVQIRGQGAAPLRAGGPVAASPRKQRDPHGRRWAILMAAGGVVIIALVALLVTGVLGGGGGGKAKSSSSSRSSATGTPAPRTTKPKPKPKLFVRRNTTVSVINGTVATGLARETEDQLVKAGFGRGVPATGADQSHSATVIYYQPGHKRDAQEVKRVLKGGAIEAIGGNNPIGTVCAVKADQPPPCGSAVDVIVVVGSDRTQ